MAPTALIPQHFPYLRKNDPPKGFHVLVLHHSSGSGAGAGAGMVALGWMLQLAPWGGAALDSAQVISPSCHMPSLIPPSYILAPWHPGPFIGTPNSLGDGLQVEWEAPCFCSLPSSAV